MQGVNIINKQQSASASTNEKGQFELSVFGDNDTLIFSHTGFGKMILAKRDVAGMGIIKLEPKIVMLQPYIFSESRVKEERQEVTRKIEVIDQKEIEFYNPQTSADVLKTHGEVYIQKSQMGGGSPVIRGFEANRVLMVVDGVRMNNAIYRSGHLQNAITIDPAILQRAEVFFGPGSVVYGSDALGGVVHYYTKEPKFSTIKDSMTLSVNTYARYASANNETSAHVDASYGGNNWAGLSSLTTSDFQDLKTGSVAITNYGDYGLTPYYAINNNGVDSQVVNHDPLVQRGTAYGQIDFMQKLRYKFNDSVEVMLNAQYSTSSDIPRYDQLSIVKNGALKWAEWKYGPQERLLTSLKTTIRSGNMFFNRLNIIGSFQKIGEDRINRKFGNTERTIRNEDVYVYGLNADFVKDFRSQNAILQYGVEAYYNDVSSYAYNQDIVTGDLSAAIERYPDGGSYMLMTSAYATMKKEWDKHVAYVGARYSQNMLESNFHDTLFYKLPFDKISLNNGALTGSANYVFKPTDQWKINVVLGSAFRSPNVDDVGKVREKNGLVLVPNDQVKPEYAYTGELGITKGFADNSLQVNVRGYYTYMVDAIVRQNYKLNGKDSLLIDGVMARVQTNMNSAEAQVYGGSVNINWDASPEFNIRSTATYTYGWDITNDRPLGHIPPVYGRTALNYRIQEKVRTTFWVDYNAWKHIWNYSTTGEDNQSNATADGTPAWYTINISTQFELTKSLYLQLAVKNMMDVRYRTFASGVSAPGRNVVLTLRAHL